MTLGRAELQAAFVVDQKNTDIQERADQLDFDLAEFYEWATDWAAGNWASAVLEAGHPAPLMSGCLVRGIELGLRMAHARRMREEVGA